MLVEPSLELFKALWCSLKRLRLSFGLHSWNKGSCDKCTIRNIYPTKRRWEDGLLICAMTKLLCTLLFSFVVRPPWSSVLFPRHAWSGHLIQFRLAGCPEWKGSVSMTRSSRKSLSRTHSHSSADATIIRESFFSQTAVPSLLGQTSLLLCSLDEPAQCLIATRNYCRPGEKQVRAHGRKRHFTPPAHHAQAASETTTRHEGG